MPSKVRGRDLAFGRSYLWPFATALENVGDFANMPPVGTKSDHRKFGRRQRTGSFLYFKLAVVVLGTLVPTRAGFPDRHCFPGRLGSVPGLGFGRPSAGMG